jgi:hypothetical protein
MPGFAYSPPLYLYALPDNDNFSFVLTTSLVLSITRNLNLTAISAMAKPQNSPNVEYAIMIYTLDVRNDALSGRKHVVSSLLCRSVPRALSNIQTRTS